jgi:hypothetical protein
MLTKAEFTRLLKIHGVPATWIQPGAAPLSKNIQLVFSLVGREISDEAIVNAYGADAHKLQVLSDDLPVAPAKFDAFLVGGKRHVVDVVIPMFERGTGALVYYICVCKGVS